MAGIRGIVFDEDGTLFDFQATWGVWTGELIADLAGGDAGRAHALAEAMAYDRDAQRLRPESIFISSTLDVSARVLLPEMGPGWTLQRLVGHIRDASAHVPQVPTLDLGTYLDALLAEGYVLGVATNDSEAPARAHLAHWRVADRFAFIAGADSGWGGKPAPGQLLAFLDETGFGAEETVMVGDSTHDLRAGRAAGMATVGVLTGLAAAGDLAPHADVVLPDIGHLPDWLNGRVTP